VFFVSRSLIEVEHRQSPSGTSDLQSDGWFLPISDGSRGSGGADRVADFREDHDLIPHALKAFFCQFVSRLGKLHLPLA
jgi:hypothetical protein